MKKLLAVAVVLLAIAAAAQEAVPKPEHSGPPAPSISAAYRVDVTISELENGKRVSSHSYTLHQGEGYDWARLRLGSRVPVVSGANGQFNYIDAGTNIDTKVEESATGLVVRATIDISSIASREKVGDTLLPVVRQFRYTTVTLVTPGKPAILNAADDPVSNRRIEIELTATRLK